MIPEGRLSTTAKNTILKAIHNHGPIHGLRSGAVNDSEKYNFESNSQPRWNFSSFRECCQRQRKIQFWKQFTTWVAFWISSSSLSTTAKNTILKAIHNKLTMSKNKPKAVNDSEKYNFESNSQPRGRKLQPRKCCQRQRKIQFWKQFTT